jgi:acyl-CoA thioester hydrolase
MSPSFSHVLVVRYAECDAQGVVFNAHYQALCDAVFDLWVLARLGREWQRSIGADFSMVVSSAFQYRSPARFLDAIRIEAHELRGDVDGRDRRRPLRSAARVRWRHEVRLRGRR